MVVPCPSLPRREVKLLTSESEAGGEDGKLDEVVKCYSTIAHTRPPYEQSFVKLRFHVVRRAEEGPSATPKPMFTHSVPSGGAI